MIASSKRTKFSRRPKWELKGMCFDLSNAKIVLRLLMLCTLLVKVTNEIHIALVRPELDPHCTNQNFITTIDRCSG